MSKKKKLLSGIISWLSTLIHAERISSNLSHKKWNPHVCAKCRFRFVFQVMAGPAGICNHVGLEANVEGHLERSSQQMSQKKTERLAGAAVITTQSQSQRVNLYSVSQDFHRPFAPRVTDILNAITAMTASFWPFCYCSSSSSFSY